MSNNCQKREKKLKVINVGLKFFYDALFQQDCKATHINWRMPVKQDEEITKIMQSVNDEKMNVKIEKANHEAVNCIINSDPAWIDILPAIDVIEGMDDYTILHSGPPIDYDDMVMLHQRGLVSACLFEKWAKNEQEAIALIKSGKLKILSALDTNTVGAGTGIITKSVALMVIKDRRTGKIAGTFPAEGAFQGGFCGWGLYSKDIAENLWYMREQLFPVLRKLLKVRGEVSLKPILAESFQMGDENHTKQSGADLLFEHQVIPALFKLDAPQNEKIRAMEYIVDTPRFFHCFGQGASRCAMLSSVGIEYSTMVTAVCGNGVEFGIKIAALGDEWFCTEAPMMKGRYTSSKYTIKDQLPWLGDSCVVECAGMGGLAAAASPVVCSLRGMKLKDAIALTKEMNEICITKNHNFPIPNLDFDFLPVGIDMVKVLQTGITPELHGGMFNHEGGLIGAGGARVPIACFEKAMKAYAKKYNL